MTDYSIFSAGSIVLQSGARLDDAFIAYKTYGELNSDKTNAIVFNTPFPANHTDIEWFIGSDKPLDPMRFFIVIPNLIGNGLSVSPSNWRPPVDSSIFPPVSIYDNVAQQRRLLLEKFAIDEIACAIGYSVGGQQAFQWACLFPDKVRRLVAICSTARTSRHNKVFLESLRSALTADPCWHEGRFSGPASRGLKAVAHAFAAWAVSPSFYRENLDATLGYTSLDDFLQRGWEAGMLRRDANNLMTMLWTWQTADISANSRFNGDFEAALRAITAETLIMPATTDMYFSAEDGRHEAHLIPNATVRPLVSPWGHRAGNPMQSPEDLAFLTTHIRELLVTHQTER
jgi:homoserine O-acetyltransferase/O-succinyltransferase